MAGPWFYRSGATGTGDGLSWTNARTSLGVMTSVLAGDRIWVADDHNQALGAALTVTFPGTAASPNIVICADHLVASPTPTDYKTTGVVSTTGTFAITVGGSAYIYGLTFASGLTSIAINGLAVGAGTGSWQYYDTCVLRLATTSTSASSRLTLGATGNGIGNKVVLDNTAVNFAHVAQNISPQQGSFVWRNTTNPFPNQVPTTMVGTYSQPFSWTFEAVDFLTVDVGKTLFAAGLTHYRAALYGCRIGGNGTVTAAITAPGSEVIMCHSGIPSSPPLVSRLIRYTLEGTEQTDITVCRVGGANDSVRSYSRTYIPNANSLPMRPFTGLPIVVWNDTVSSNVTINLYGIRNTSGGPAYNHQMWFEVQYMADTSLSPIVTIDHCGVKPNYSSNNTQWAADTSDWTAGNVVARANSQAYNSTSSIMKVASNPGRVFVCTSSGTSASTEPAAFATAIDGDNINDGTAVFKTAARFRMSMTLSSPQVKLAGPIYIIPKVANMSGTVPFLWLDPVAVIT